MGRAIVAAGALGLAVGLALENRRLRRSNALVSDAAPMVILRGGLELLAEVEAAMYVDWDEDAVNAVHEEALAYRAAVDEHVVIED